MTSKIHHMKMTDLESPFTGGLVEEVIETRNYEMRGQQVTVSAAFYRCVDTGELFTSGEQDEAILLEMYRQYRERNQVPRVDVLKRRRKELGISAREASQLLGFGINQFSQYEAGELPSESNTLLLQFFCNERQLQSLLDARMHVLQTRTIQKLQQAVQQRNGLPRVRRGANVTTALDSHVWAGSHFIIATGIHDEAAAAILYAFGTKAQQAASVEDYAPAAF